MDYPYLGGLRTMDTNHLLTRMILQVSRKSTHFAHKLVPSKKLTYPTKHKFRKFVDSSWCRFYARKYMLVPWMVFLISIWALINTPLSQTLPNDLAMHIFRSMSLWTKRIGVAAPACSHSVPTCHLQLTRVQKKDTKITSLMMSKHSY